MELGRYSSDNQAVVDQHIQDLDYADIDVAIASWWGVDRQKEANRIPQLLDRTTAADSDLKWAIYYESEGFGNPGVTELESDLAYLKARYTQHQSFARIDGKPVIFVYNADDTSCEVADRWAQATNGEWYVVLKVFGGYKNCASQPDDWHQYGPATPVSHVAGDSYNISAGFWRANETSPRLARDPSRWTQNVRDMVASEEPWQLITSYNEWGEGTATERCHDWSSNSGYGVYLDALHSDGADISGDTVDAGTLDNKIMAGYQGWFMADGDGAGVGWRHWSDGSGNTPKSDNITIDMWPDLREYDADELFDTSFKYSNGSTAGLYSAYTPKTVDRHVKWMRDYGIDGVFVQRFISEAINMRGVRDRVLQNIRTSSEKYGRVFANMYDISGGNSGSLVDDIKNDWKHLVDDLRITESSRYLHHNGRPVLSIWGFNVNGRPGSASQAGELIRWLTTAAPAKYRATVKLGVDDNWREDSADWQQAYRSADIISPWAVGRYGDNSGANRFRNNIIEPDLADLNGENIDYMPVVFPGFSWWNLKGEKYNHIKRNGGRFLWRQFYNAIDAGCKMVYVAMFDEVDEGTAIYKVAGSDSQTPTTGRFVTLDEDGETLPSDWYLRLTGEATKMLRNQISLTSTIPIDPVEGGGASNRKPQADAGSGQTVTEGLAVTLNAGSSSDPDGRIVSYLWEQIDGTSVTLSNSRSIKAAFVAPNVGISGDSLTFRITVTDDGGLTDSDTGIVEVTREVVVDSDGDGVPDDQDDFPYDADEYLDTDGDGEGNNADTDDDNDGMPDDWELTYGLNPLEDDAGSDPDGDDVSNINEFNLGTAPNHSEGNFKPDTPALLMPENGATVSLTPQFETGDFNDPNVNDDHSQTQWVVIRAFDDVCVFDVTSNASLTSLTLPKHILEEDTEYIWKARFIDNHDTPSEWSEEREFISGFADHDTDKDGVPDVQEVADTLDLDADGTTDIDQTDIKCVSCPTEKTKTRFASALKTLKMLNPSFLSKCRIPRIPN